MQDVDKKTLQRLGKCIKTIRLKRKWKLSTMSHYAGISPSTLKRIEAGSSEPKYLTLEKLASSFELSLIEFLKLCENI